MPEFLLRRFNLATHLFNALTFALAAVLIGWPIWLSIAVSAFFVLAYITLGGLSGAIYNEVLQFFVIIAGLVPLVIIGLHRRLEIGPLPDALKPGFQCARTHWNRGFMAFQLVRRTRTMVLMVPVGPESGFREGAARSRPISWAY